MTTAEQNYNAGASHRAEIHKEINANPIKVDRLVFKKDASEKAELATMRSRFKNNGLYDWNERNRPGNNK